MAVSNRAFAGGDGYAELQRELRAIVSGDESDGWIGGGDWKPPVDARPVAAGK